MRPIGSKCFAADFIEAEKNEDLIIPRKGESTIDAIRRHMERKQKEKMFISMRLPVYVISEAKVQAKKAGISYTSYMQAILETAITKSLPQTKAMARASK